MKVYQSSSINEEIKRENCPDNTKTQSTDRIENSATSTNEETNASNQNNPTNRAKHSEHYAQSAKHDHLDYLEHHMEEINDHTDHDKHRRKHHSRRSEHSSRPDIYGADQYDYPGRSDEIDDYGDYPNYPNHAEQRDEFPRSSAYSTEQRSQHHPIRPETRSSGLNRDGRYDSTRRSESNQYDSDKRSGQRSGQDDSSRRFDVRSKNPSTGSIEPGLKRPTTTTSRPEQSSYDYPNQTDMSSTKRLPRRGDIGIQSIDERSEFVQISRFDTITLID